MTRLEKKEELIGLFSTGSIFIGDMLDEAMDFAEKNIEKEATRKIVECSEFLAKLPHWISVEDALPPCKKDVLLWSSGFDVVLKGFRENDGLFYVYDDDNYWHNITHWVSLPAPPTCSGKPNNCKKGGEK